MGTGWNRVGKRPAYQFIITDWDMGTGWNLDDVNTNTVKIITDWDMGTGWNNHCNDKKI